MTQMKYKALEGLLIGGPSHGDLIKMTLPEDSDIIGDILVNHLPYRMETFSAENIKGVDNGEYLVWVHGEQPTMEVIIPAIRKSGLRPNQNHPIPGNVDTPE
jgi:hypothetical protein